MFRTYVEQDFSACIEIVNVVWQFDKKFPPPPLSNLFKRMYTGGSLAASNFYIVREEENQVVGFLFGKCGDNPVYRNEYSGIWGNLRFLWQLFAVKDVPIKKKFRYVKIINAHEINRRKVEPSRINEVNLFAVDPAMQGKGYRKLLMSAYIAQCRTLHVSRVTLDTDAACNYRFYEQFGFTMKGRFYSPLQQEYSGSSGESYVYELNL